jgi:hypothetical protein
MQHLGVGSVCDTVQCSCPAAAHIVMLYLWQIALLRPHVVHRAASWLGLYILSSDTPFPALGPQLLHIAALVLLFGALGCRAGRDPAATSADDPSTRVRARLSYMAPPATPQATPARGRSQVAGPPCVLCMTGNSRPAVVAVDSQIKAARSHSKITWAICLKLAGNPPMQRQREAGSPDSDLGLWWGGPLEMPAPGGAPLQTIADHSGTEQQPDADVDGSIRQSQHGEAPWADADGEDDWEAGAPSSGGHRLDRSLAVQQAPVSLYVLEACHLYGVSATAHGTVRCKCWHCHANRCLVVSPTPCLLDCRLLGPARQPVCARAAAGAGGYPGAGGGGAGGAAHRRRRRARRICARLALRPGGR